MVFGSRVLTFDHENLPPRIQPVLMLTFFMSVITAARFAIEPLPSVHASLMAVRMTCTAP